MDTEEEIVPFGETVLWVECDFCGRAFAGLGLDKVLVAVERINICVECLRKSENKWETSAGGVGCRGSEV